MVLGKPRTIRGSKPIANHVIHFGQYIDYPEKEHITTSFLQQPRPFRNTWFKGNPMGTPGISLACQQAP